MTLLYGNAADSEAITGEENFVPDAAPYLQGTGNYTVSPGVEENLVQQTPIIQGSTDSGIGNPYVMGSSGTGFIDNTPVVGVTQSGGGLAQTPVAPRYIPPLAAAAPSVNINTPAAIPMATPTMPIFGAAQAGHSAASTPTGAPLNPIAAVPTGPNLSSSANGGNAMPSGNFNASGPRATGGGGSPSMYPPFHLGAQVNVGQQVASAQPTPVGPNPNPPVGGGGQPPPEVPPGGSPSVQFASPISAALKTATPLIQSFHNMLDNVAQSGGQALHDAGNAVGGAATAAGNTIRGAIGNLVDATGNAISNNSGLPPASGADITSNTVGHLLPGGTAAAPQPNAQHTTPTAAPPAPGAPAANQINNAKIRKQVDEAAAAKQFTFHPMILQMAQSIVQTAAHDVQRMKDLQEKATKNFFHDSPRDPKTGLSRPSILSQIKQAVYAPLNTPTIPVSGALPAGVQADIDKTIADAAKSAANNMNNTAASGLKPGVPKTPPGFGGYEQGTLGGPLDPDQLAQQAIEQQGTLHKFSPRYFAHVYLPAEEAELGQQQDALKKQIDDLNPDVTAAKSTMHSLDSLIKDKNAQIDAGDTKAQGVRDRANAMTTDYPQDKVHKMEPMMVPKTEPMRDSNGEVIRDTDGKVKTQEVVDPKTGQEIMEAARDRYGNVKMQQAVDPKTGQPIMIPNPQIKHAIPHPAYFAPIQELYNDVSPSGRANQWASGKSQLWEAQKQQAANLRVQADSWDKHRAQLQREQDGLMNQRKSLMDEQKGVIDQQDALLKQSDNLTARRKEIGEQIKSFQGQEQYADLTVQQFQQEFQKNLAEQMSQIVKKDQTIQGGNKLAMMGLLSNEAIERQNRGDILHAAKAMSTQGVQQNVGQLKAMESQFNAYTTQLQKQFGPAATLGRPLNADQKKAQADIIQKQSNLSRQILGVINNLPAASALGPDATQSGGINPKDVKDMLGEGQQPEATQ